MREIEHRWEERESKWAFWISNSRPALVRVWNALGILYTQIPGDRFIKDDFDFPRGPGPGYWIAFGKRDDTGEEDNRTMGTGLMVIEIFEQGDPLPENCEFFYKDKE